MISKNLSNFTNLLLKVDSYCHSFHLQFPANTQASESYIVSRGGPSKKILFFGLQSILREHFSKPLTHADIDEAAHILELHGLPFNEEGWRRIVSDHRGRLPIRIKAVKEGSWVDIKNALAVIQTTEDGFAWLVPFIESILLRVWYPTSVATLSGNVRNAVKPLFFKSSENMGALDFFLHDFGNRGATSNESAMIGGMSHLVSFRGTDTLPALIGVHQYYGIAGSDVTRVAGYSIPASAHTTITSWGKQKEINAYRNILDTFLDSTGKIVACVSDSYDYENAVRNIWGKQLKTQIVNSGGTLVIRPDSGDPKEQVLKTLVWLDDAFGHHVNSKGYKVLKHVRIIQGDGVNEHSIVDIAEAVVDLGYSIDNVSFGMGGALLQAVNRDKHSFAMKTCAVKIDEIWHAVFKDPKDDQGKSSEKIGRLTLVRKNDSGEYKTVPIDFNRSGHTEVLYVVWENGEFFNEVTFPEVIARAT